MFKKTALFIIISFIYGLVGVEASSLNDSFRSFILDETVTDTKPVSIDSASQHCMSCHNGTSGSHIQIKDATRPMQFTGFGTRAHPVGMKYVNYAAQKPYILRAREALNPLIKLVDGRVGCLSCHKVKQDEMLAITNQSTASTTMNSCTSSKELTVGPQRSKLCLSCHKR